jgi:trehalose synthase
MHEVSLPEVALAPYQAVLGGERVARLRASAGRAGRMLGGSTIWNVNSTAAGGGVAELLSVLCPLARAVGLDMRWLVIDADAEFYDIAKRLVSLLYGTAGDGGSLGDSELGHYQRVLRANASDLSGQVRRGDVVVVHDAQPAGLIGTAADLGALAVWRSHIGSDQPNEHTRSGQAFVRPFVELASATVFSTPGHVPGWAPRPEIIPPSIDPCGPKNMTLRSEDAAAILIATGILAGRHRLPLTVQVPVGADVRISRPALVLREGPPPPPELPMVVQVSRWDRLKDMPGVLRAFIASGQEGYLTLAGADVGGVADDPGAASQYDECRQVWDALPAAERCRCQLVCLPMADLRENAVIVNALQQHASVVVQKSLAEGFGLTATEAMWKSRPLLASAVGGLRDQVVHGETGLLLDDPADLREAAAKIRLLLTDRELAARLGSAARQRVLEHYLPDRQLRDGLRVLEQAVSARADGRMWSRPPAWMSRSGGAEWFWHEVCEGSDASVPARPARAGDNVWELPIVWNYLLFSGVRPTRRANPSRYSKRCCPLWWHRHLSFRACGTVPRPGTQASGLSVTIGYSVRYRRVARSASARRLFRSILPFAVRGNESSRWYRRGTRYGGSRSVRNADKTRSAVSVPT